MDTDIDVRRSPSKRVARLLERGAAATRKIEAAAFGRERLRHRQADTLASPGDERALALQSQIHRCPPSARAHSGAARGHQIRREPDDQ